MKIDNPTGIFLNANLRLEILVEGKGLGFNLSPAHARDLARVLLDRAHALESQSNRAEQTRAVEADGRKLLVSPN